MKTGNVDVHIRPIRDDELDALGQVTVDVYTNIVPGLLPDDYLAELADVRGRVEEGLVLVAVDGEGVLLGGVTYLGRPGRWASMEGPDQAELRMLVVIPEAQGKGVGTALVQACVHQARLDGKRQVTLHTTEFMPAAQRLYERAGFRRAPATDLMVEGDMCLLSYVLDLDG